jgi:hypothetical protein
VSVAKQQMLQLVAAGRAALADGATDADRDALRAVFAHPELPLGSAEADAPPPTAAQQLVRDTVDELKLALEGQGDAASARSLLDKVEKKANVVRRRRGGRKKTAGPAFPDDEDDDGDAAE